MRHPIFFSLVALVTALVIFYNFNLKHQQDSSKKESKDAKVVVVMKLPFNMIIFDKVKLAMNKHEVSAKIISYKEAKLKGVEFKSKLILLVGINEVLIVTEADTARFAGLEADIMSFLCGDYNVGIAYSDEIDRSDLESNFPVSNKFSRRIYCTY